MRMRTSTVLLSCLFTLLLISSSSGYELNTRYASLTYNSEDLLRKFNKEIALGSLSYLLRNRRSITVDDEIRNKMEVIVEKVEAILEMHPKELRFTVSLLPSEDAIHETYRRKYGKTVDFVSFYSPRDKTIFVSVKDIDLAVLAHEIAHAVIDLYYGMATPSKIHEVLAQYVESHLRD